MTDIKHTEPLEEKDIKEKKDSLPDDDDDSSDMDSEEVKRLLNQKYRRPKHACQYCKQLFSSRQTKAYHEAVARCFGKLHTCKRCLKPFDAPWRLERHQRQRVRCEPLDKVIITKDGNRYLMEKYSTSESESEE